MLASLLLLAQEAAEKAQEAPNPILPSKDEMIYGIGAFAVIFFFMWKYGYPAVKKAMDDRTERIRANLDNADRVRAEAQTILDEYQRQLNDARGEANRIIEEARQTAESLRRDLMTRAEAEVAELRVRASEEVAAAQERALNDLRARVAELAISAAEKVVEKSLDRQTNIALVENFIQSVGSSRP
jgi:F-type H+-transporting ATPase subunit b